MRRCIVLERPRQKFLQVTVEKNQGSADQNYDAFQTCLNRNEQNFHNCVPNAIHVKSQLCENPISIRRNEVPETL